MSPVLVCVLLVVRGRWGSVTDQDSQERLRDSLTLRAFLEAHDLRLPARSTVHENLNVVSKRTLRLLFACEVMLAMNEGLDDFARYFLDSTAVEANSRHPTDSGNLSRSLHRAYHSGQKLDQFGLPQFRQWTMPRWLRSLRKLDFEISTAAGKPKSARKVKSLYRDAVEVGDKMIPKLLGELDWVRSQFDPAQLPPSTRLQCETLLAQIEEDCMTAAILVCNIEKRVLEGANLEPWQRVPSLSDRSAAFIVKGGRPAVVGYRPQLVRSGNGLVVHLETPEGNAADSPQLVPCINAAIERTGCCPREVSVDDGYSSADGRQALLDRGIEIVSISGSKGKRITPPEDWDSLEYQVARNDRSSVESLMFSLKFTVEFGLLRRRGIEAVRCELLEKVIAYNLARIVVLRREKAEALRKAG
jgi:hypothetical protein